MSSAEEVTDYIQCQTLENNPPSVTDDGLLVYVYKKDILELEQIFL